MLVRASTCDVGSTPSVSSSFSVAQYSRILPSCRVKRCRSSSESSRRASRATRSTIDGSLDISHHLPPPNKSTSIASTCVSLRLVVSTCLRRETQGDAIGRKETSVFDEQGERGSLVGSGRQQDPDRVCAWLSGAIPLLHDVQPRIRDDDRDGTPAAQRKTDGLSGLDLHLKRPRGNRPSMGPVLPGDSRRRRGESRHKPSRGFVFQDPNAPIPDAPTVANPGASSRQPLNPPASPPPARETAAGEKRIGAGRG